MIIEVRNNINRRWVGKLADLKLDPFKIKDSEEEGEEIVYNIPPPKIVVGEEQDTGRRMFSLFESHVELFKYIREIQSRKDIPHLYEICPYFMKIHFDVDLSLDGIEKLNLTPQQVFEDPNFKYEHILKPILNSLIETFETLFKGKVLRNNILVFEAHRKGEKISFHIVVDKYYLSWKDCRYFYEKVKSHLQCQGFGFQASVVDSSVYKKNQNFRTMFSNKLSKKDGIKLVYSGPDMLLNRGLKLSQQLMTNSSLSRNDTVGDITTDILEFRIFSRSLLTNLVSCTRLEMEYSKTEILNTVFQSNTRNSNGSPKTRVNDGDLEKMLKVFFSHPVSKTEKGETAFEYYCVVEQFVLVKRLKKKDCEICKKVHDHEHAYILHDSTGQVFFICRRAQESKLKDGIKMYIGSIAEVNFTP